MEIVKCCICNSDNYKNLYKIKRSDGTINIVKCKNCGHIYQNPRLSDNEIKKAYNKIKKFYRTMPRKTNIMSFNLLNNKRLEEIEKYANKGKVLDIGCSFGNFLNTAKKRGWETYGNDISKYISDFAKKKMKLNVFYGTIEQIKYPKEFFDTITLFDVIEHLPDPKKTLKECNRIMKKNGLLIIQTPAIDSIYAKIKGKNWEYFGIQHLNYFSKKSLETLLKKTGFKIIKIYYGSDIGFLTSIKAYLLNKENKRNIVSIIKFILVQILKRLHIGNISFGSRVYYAVKV
ncbi:MAG: class I SAM-dependent methyltransferase [Candidatus Aenigmatarchaeota archaeon]